MTSYSNWPKVTPTNLCLVCGKGDRCSTSPDGNRLFCWRDGNIPPGWVLEKRGKSGGASYVKGEAAKSEKETPTTDWRVLGEACTQGLTDEMLGDLASALSVTPESLRALGIGWATREQLQAMGASGADWHQTDSAGWRESFPGGAFTVIERDGKGRSIGMSLRTRDGRKGSPSKVKAGAKRGLTIPANLDELRGTVLFVEGASDVAACLTLGLPAVGRPSNMTGASDAATLLDGRTVVVVGERDQKADGSWPGRDGAHQIAQRMATIWKNTVEWSLPPAGCKDVRAWLQSRVASGLDLTDTAACKAAGQELMAELMTAAKELVPERKSQSAMLVQLALETYRIGRTDRDEPFAVARQGPNVAIMFRGSKESFRSKLSNDYRKLTGQVPSATALADMLTSLQGLALDVEAEPVFLRVADHENSVVIDLGDATGRAIVINASGWKIVDVSPVLFRRTALTAALPEPQRGGDLESLRSLLNVSDETWPLLVGWLIATFIPGIAHPILMLGGLQGTGKTTAARYIVGVFDPSPAPVRSPPRDQRAWAISAAGGWGIAVDNVSTIPDWWSDALCKSVTGDGWIDRKLYTDDEVSVLSFRRVVMITSIDAGSLRGDLGDRLVKLDLLRISERGRRSEAEMDRLYAEHRPFVLGAILDLLVGVLARLPHVVLESMPRMADFAKILAAIDSVARDVGGNGRALDIYLGQSGRIAQEVVDGDPVAEAVVRLVEDVKLWEGTAGDLLTKLTPERIPKNWPKAANKLTGQLKRLTPALSAVGVTVTIPETRTKDGRIITLEKASDGPSPVSPSSPERDGRVIQGDDCGDDWRGATEGSSHSIPAKAKPGDGNDDGDDRKRSAPARREVIEL